MMTNSEFQATMQPGDNFRLAANGDRDFLLQLENDDKKQNVGRNEKEKNANKQRICHKVVQGDPEKREIRISEHYASDVLTVWRFLHVETDSMTAPPATGDEKNIVDGKLALAVGIPEWAQSVYLNVNLKTSLRDNSANLTAGAGNGRFENGWIKIGTGSGRPGATTTTDLLGNGDDFVREDTGIDIPALTSKTGLPDVRGTVAGWDGRKGFALYVTSGRLTESHPV